MDREGFAQAVTAAIRENPLVTLVEEEVTDYSRFAPEDYVITASGPLTSGALSEAIQQLVKKDYFHFFDAAAPIVTVDSLDQEKVYKASRYDKGEAAYYNCPFTKEEYIRFWQELCRAETAPVKDFEHNVFEACMPIEEMASGERTPCASAPRNRWGCRIPGPGRTLMRWSSCARTTERGPCTTLWASRPI